VIQGRLLVEEKQVQLQIVAVNVAVDGVQLSVCPTCTKDYN
jgi:hypothetical protein